MFKNLVICLALTVATFGFSQNQLQSNYKDVSQTKINNLEVVVTVDSAKDVINTFKVEDIEEIIKETGPNESLTFSLVCNGALMSNGKKSTMTYKIEGNSNEPEEFLTLVAKLRKSAIKYYKH